jgi:hypothetical protein
LADTIVTVQPDQQNIALVPSGFEIGHMSRMQQIKAAVCHHQAFTRRPLSFPPGWQVRCGNDFSAKIHLPNLAEGFCGWQGRRNCELIT